MPAIPNIGIGIRDIQIRSLNIPQTPNWLTNSPSIFLPTSPPVTQQIGTPIVNLPGCVEFNENNRGNNNNLITDDPGGNRIYCDAGAPSFNPINFEPEETVPTYPDESRSNTGAPAPGGVDTRGQKGEEEGEETPIEATPTPVPEVAPVTVSIQCPSSEQLRTEPIGFIFDSGRKEIIGYRLEGTQCIREVSDVPFTDQVVNAIPPTGAVITTGSIAVVATTSALLAKPFVDILLKVIRPSVKKVIKKVAKMRGKKPILLSRSERIIEQRDRNHVIMNLRRTFKRK